MGRGRLIVLEGVDGAGTSTQVNLLAPALTREGFATHSTKEPSDGPVGMLIRQILAGRMVVPGRAGPRPPRMETMALLFAADRLDHLESEMLPNLGDGVTVVSDRYIHSSIAYQTLTAGFDETKALDWVHLVNSKARAPDLVLLVEVSATEAHRRRQLRGGAEEMYEEDELQQKLAAFYSDLPNLFPEQRFVVIDGEQSVEGVHSACLEACLSFLREDTCAT